MIAIRADGKALPPVISHPGVLTGEREKNWGRIAFLSSFLLFVCWKWQIYCPWRRRSSASRADNACTQKKKWKSSRSVVEAVTEGQLKRSQQRKRMHSRLSFLAIFEMVYLYPKIMLLDFWSWWLCFDDESFLDAWLIIAIEKKLSSILMSCRDTTLQRLRRYQHEMDVLSIVLAMQMKDIECGELYCCCSSLKSDFFLRNCAKYLRADHRSFVIHRYDSILEGLLTIQHFMALFITTTEAIFNIISFDLEYLNLPGSMFCLLLFLPACIFQTTTKSNLRLGTWGWQSPASISPPFHFAIKIVSSHDPTITNDAIYCYKDMASDVYFSWLVW